MYSLYISQRSTQDFIAQGKDLTTTQLPLENFNIKLRNITDIIID